MSLAKPLALACPLILAGLPAAQAAEVGGQAALALASVVALYAPIPAANKKAVASFFKGDTNFPFNGKITVTADKIECRTSNVDVTARSCDIDFKIARRTLKGREANELYATQAMAGIAAGAAAGSNYESLTKLACTLDPAKLRDKAGEGATCSYETGN